MNPIVIIPVRLRVCSNIAKIPSRAVVWWYGPLEKNSGAKSVPKITVIFRLLNSQGEFVRFVEHKTLLTNLGLLRIGTVWDKGQLIGKVQYRVEQFEMSFTMDDWTIFSLDEYAKKRGVKYPIPAKKYKLPYPKDKNYLINFRINNNKFLVIPCIELYMRMFGRSTEIKRILATYPWHDVESKLFPNNVNADHDTWEIHIPRQFKKDDLIFLAHLKNDEYAKSVSKSIYSQIESVYNNSNNNPSNIFLKACPWFKGTASLKVEGMWLTEKIFLGLRISGASDPQGCVISYVHIDDDADEKTPSGSTSNGSKPLIRVLKTPPMLAKISSEFEPDQGAEILEVEEDDFEILGQPRVITKVSRAKSKGESASCRLKFVNPDDQCESFSPGQAYGGKKRVGGLVQHSPAVIETSGVLMEMWNAALHLHNSHPDKILSVEWFTFEDGFSSGPKPELISLVSQNVVEGSNTSMSIWNYLDITLGQARGVLIMRLKTTSNNIYIVEIQRRIKFNDIENSLGNSEEHYKGLVFTLRDDSAVKQWLSKIVDEVISIQGIIQNFKLVVDGSLFSFKHSFLRDGNYSYESCIKNALKKCKIIL